MPSDLMRGTFMNSESGQTKVDYDEPDFNRLIEQAEHELLHGDRQGQVAHLKLCSESEKLCWFVLPQEIELELAG